MVKCFYGLEVSKKALMMLVLSLVFVYPHWNTLKKVQPLKTRYSIPFAKGFGQMKLIVLEEIYVLNVICQYFG